MIEVLEPGALTSVQTADGRVGWRHLGIPVGGAVDPWSARLANRLVGNPDGAAILELTLFGPSLRFSTPAIVALVGPPFDATISGLALPRTVGCALRSGSTLRVGEGQGARGYLAVAGGIEVDAVLGSAATDLRTGFGGFEGRALRAGDRLTVGSATGPPRRWTGSLAPGPMRIVPGPQHDQRVIETLVGSTWVVAAASDRTGARLGGPALRAAEPEIGSMGLPLGAIQVPPDGQPIVMLADRPVTGGYPVPACVVRADIGRVAALRAGDELRFASVSVEEAVVAYRLMEVGLEALEDVDWPPDAKLGWTGALE